MLTKNEPRWFTNTLKLVADRGVELPASRWQSQDVSDKDEMSPIELMSHTMDWPVLTGTDWAQQYYRPNLPWAEDHFQERVSGEPLNPPPSEQWWPFRVRGNSDHKHGEIFSHTYPERIWPKWAGVPGELEPATGYSQQRGIRYAYGDLDDVVDLIVREPLTRQAFLPIWFPEDTGAIDGQRVPCTLGYHFLFRPDADGLLRGTITYYMRSCDVLRHLKDDAYMAARLLQWVVGKLKGYGITAQPNTLIMHVASLHIFKGDLPMVNRFLAEQEEHEYGYGV